MSGRRPVGEIQSASIQIQFKIKGAPIMAAKLVFHPP
jgi:hypothetical protein